MTHCIKHGFGLHPSKSEASDCDRLYADMACGRILDYGVYPYYRIQVSGKVWRDWTPDFWFIRKDGTYCLMESKRGWKKSDDRARAKMAAFICQFPQIPLYINFQPAKIAADGRLLAKAYPTLRSGKKAGKWPRKSYNRKTKRWETIKSF